MKNAILIFILIVMSQTGITQENEMRTLLGHNKLKIGGFAGPMMTFTSMDGEFAHMMGGGGCVIINDFFIGGYGMGLTNRIDYADSQDSRLNFGHGGFWLGYHFMSNKLIHPVFHVKTGWGDIKEKIDEVEEPENGDNVFVLIPTIEAEMNITRFFRITAGINYQAVFFVNDIYYSNKDFSFPGVFLSFKFGAF